MKYYVELSNDYTGVELGRLYCTHWDSRIQATRIDFTQPVLALAYLDFWEGDTGHVVMI